MTEIHVVCNAKKHEGIHWISDEDYSKAVGQLRLQLNGLFEGFQNNKGNLTVNIVGIETYPLIREIVELAEDFSLRVRGVEKPIDLTRIRGKRHGR